MNGTASGYSTAAPIWKDYISSVLDRLEPTNWPRPEEIAEVAVSKASGKLPSDETPSDMIKTEVFASFAVPTEIDNSYSTVEIETITNRLATEFSPEDTVEEKTFRIHRSLFAEIWTNWQTAIDSWAAENDEDQPPTEYANDIHNAVTASNVPEISIISPLSLSSVDIKDKMIEILVEILDEGNGLSEVEYTVNDNINYHATNDPYSGNVRVPVTASEGSILNVSARAIDQYGYSATSTIQLRVGGGDDDDDVVEEQP